MTPDLAALLESLKATQAAADALRTTHVAAEEFARGHREQAGELEQRVAGSHAHLEQRVAEQQATLDRLAALEQRLAEMIEEREQLEQAGRRLAAALRPAVMAAASTSSTSSGATVRLAESGDTFTDLRALAAEIGRMTYYLEPLARRREGQRTLWAFVTGQAAKSAEAGKRGCTRQHTRAQLRPSRPEQDHARGAPRRRRSIHAPRRAIAAPRGGEEPAHAWLPVRPEKGSRVARPSEVLT